MEWGATMVVSDKPQEILTFMFSRFSFRIADSFINALTELMLT